MQSGSWASFCAAAPPELYPGEPDDEQPDFRILRESEHTSRKRPRCDHDIPIPVGRRYKQTVVLDDGEFKIMRFCSKPNCGPCEDSYVYWVRGM
jgi:hypothetical protein